MIIIRPFHLQAILEEVLAVHFPNLQLRPRQFQAQVLRIQLRRRQCHPDLIYFLALKVSRLHLRKLERVIYICIL